MIGNPRIEIIGDVSVAAPYVEWAKPRWRALEDDGVRWYYFPDCTIQLFKAEEAGFIRVIAQGSHGIIFTPRSGGFSIAPYPLGDDSDNTPALVGNGWMPQGKDEYGNPKWGLVPYTRQDIFPRTNGYRDAVKYSLAADTNPPTLDKSSLVFLGNKSNYGNLSWESYDPRGETVPYVVSWDGPPLRYLMDVGATGPTTFGTAVYDSGIKIESEWYILGASKPNGKLFVIAYSQEIHKVFVAIYLNNVWQKLTNGTIGDLPSWNAWFPSDNGLNFIHSGSPLYIVSINPNNENPVESDVIINADPSFAPGGNATAAFGGTFTEWSANFFASYPLGADYDQDTYDAEDESGTTSTPHPISSSGYHTASTVTTGDGDSRDGTLPLTATLIRDPRGSIGSTTGDNISAGSVFYLANVVATYCSVNWSINNASFTGQGTSSIAITSITGCGTGTVTATLIGGGNDGQSFSRDVKFPSGTWVYDHCVNVSGSYSDCSRTGWPPYAPCYCTIDSHCGLGNVVGSGTKVIQYWSMITTFIYCTDYPPNPGKSCPSGYSYRGDIQSQLCGCYGDAGFTGGCCDCLKHDFDHYYRWVCP